MRLFDKYSAVSFQVRIKIKLYICYVYHEGKNSHFSSVNIIFYSELGNSNTFYRRRLTIEF